MGAHGEIEITITADKAQAAIDALAAHANKGADRIASHERQVMSQLALERKRFVAEGLANEVAALDQVMAMRKKAYDYKSQGFSQERATGMARQEVLYDTEIAAKQKAVELAKNIETSQASLNAQKLRELETAKQIAEKQASVASLNAKEQVAIQKKIQLMAAVASGDKQREQHLRAMAALERNVQAGLNAGMKPSEALQQARTMLRLEQSISQEKQKQVAVGGGPGGAAYAGARRGSAFAGGQNAAYRTGMLAQQAQDVAVSLQMGMSASRVIAQQGSQIASIFGPKGMVIGGVIAIGAAIWEMASTTAQAEKKAEALQKQWEKINAIRKEAVALEAEARQSRVTRERGEFAGEIEGQDADYQRKVIDNIERQVAVNRKKAQDINKEATGGGWRDLAQTIPILASFVDDSATANARKRKEIADGAAEEIATLSRVLAGEKAVAAEKLATFQIKQRIASQESVFASKSRAVMSDARAREVTEKDKEKTEDLEREMNFIENRNKIRDSSASAQQKNAQYAALADERAAKDDEVAATRQRKREEENAERYLKDAEKQVKLTEEKTKNEKEASQFRDTSVQKYKRAQDEVKKIESEIAKGRGYDTPEKQAELAEKKLQLLKQEEGAVKEIEAMQREGAEFAKAGLAGTEAQQRMEAVQMEINLLEKKKAFSPIEAAQTANKIALLNRELVSRNFDTGMMGAGGMQQINRNRKAQLGAMDRAEQRALGNMGLMDIKRGLGGEMISGVDPITGKILDQKEIEERKFEMGLEKDRRDLDRAHTKGDIDKASALIEKQVKQKSDLEAKAAKGDRAAQDKLDRMNKFQQNGGKENIAAGFSPEQVAALSTSIADAVKELIAK